MFKRLLGTTLSELPANTRLIVLMPIMALIVLASVITILWNKIGSEGKSELKAKDTQIELWHSQADYWKALSEQKDHRIDSMTTKSYNDKVETNRQLQLIIDKQNKQKTILRTLK